MAKRKTGDRLERVANGVAALVLVTGGAIFVVFALLTFARQDISPPTAAQISQRMAVTCPGIQSVDAVRVCSTAAADDLVQDKIASTGILQQVNANNYMALGLLVSFGSFAVSGFALVLLAMTLRETAKASQAAEQAAMAANDANAGFQQSAERQLRAYVTVSEVQLTNVGAGLVPHVRLVIRNTGQTPAEETQVVSTIYRRNSTDPVPPIPEFTPESDASVQTLGSNCVFSLESHFPLGVITAADVTSLEKGTYELGIVIRCRYLDVFGKVRELTYRAHTFYHAGELQFVAATKEHV